MEKYKPGRIVTIGIRERRTPEEKNQYVARTIQQLQNEQLEENEHNPFIKNFDANQNNLLNLYMQTPSFQAFYQQLLHHFTIPMSDSALHSNILTLAGGLNQDLSYLITAATLRNNNDGTVLLSPTRTHALVQAIAPHTKYQEEDYGTGAVKERKSMNFDSVAINGNDIKAIYEFTLATKRSTFQKKVDNFKRTLRLYRQYFRGATLCFVIPSNRSPRTLEGIREDQLTFENSPISSEECKLPPTLRSGN